MMAILDQQKEREMPARVSNADNRRQMEFAMSATRPFAIVTGASTGIGFELAKRCAKEGYDLLIAADEPAIEKAAAWLRANGSKVEAVEADLATIEGVDKLYAAAGSRP